MSTERTIVVVAHHGLGDLLMTVPLLRACDRALGAGDRLVVLVKSKTEASILDLVPTASRLEACPIGGGGARRALRVARVAAALRRRRPLMLLAPHATDGTSMAVLSRVVGARCSVGPGGSAGRFGFQRTVGVEPHMHKVQYFLRFAEAAGLPIEDEPDVRLRLPAIERDQARGRLGGPSSQHWVAIAPGSGVVEAHKRWPVPQFRRLVKNLLAHSPAISVVLFGSPAEAPLLHELVDGRSAGEGRCRVVAESDVRRAVALLSHCHSVVTGCSGAAHMAAAADVPIVGLFGPTNPGFTGPFSPKLRAIRRDLTCSPCYRTDFIRGCGEPVCMSGIEPDTVLAAVLDSLAGAPARRSPWLPTTNATAPAELPRAAVG
jgi:ADP-heptose:LPS heptosyltransferase